MTEKKIQSVGERLLLLRSQKKMTQEELAEYLDVSRQSVSKWELNKTLPDMEKLIQLSELYEVSMDYLIRGKTLLEFGKRECNPGTIEEPLPEEYENAFENGNALESETHTRQDTFPNGLEGEYSAQRIVFILATVFSGILCICMFAFAGRLIGKNVATFDNKQQDIILIDRIYEQYTKADVWMENENGNYLRETVWLDVPGVREQDYIHYYSSNDKPGSIFFEYYGKTLLIPLIAGVILLIFTIIFGIGWSITTHRKEWENHGREKE